MFDHNNLIDFDVETYATVDLKKVGSYAYAQHPDTDCLCVSWRFPGLKGKKGRWRQGDKPPQDLIEAYLSGTHLLSAHNVQFDAEILRYVLGPKYGWPWPGYEAFYCSMAAGCIAGLPGQLEKAAKFFGTTDKDVEGGKLMKRMCKPAPKIQSNSDPKRLHTRENLVRLAKYCDTDVAAEHHFMQHVPPLSDTEEQVWRTTWKMNRRGVLVDTKLAQRCIEIAEQVQDHYRAQLARQTKGKIETETQRIALGKWLHDRGVELPQSEAGNFSMAKEVVADLDIDSLDDEPREVLETYRTLNKSSLAKFHKMLATLSSDGRIHGMIAYAAASATGRWAGRGVQLQNMPRGMFEEQSEYDLAREIIMDGADADELELLYGSPMSVLASMIRPCLIAAPGHKLRVADYSAIEARGLVWLASDQSGLQTFLDGKDPYKVAAAVMYGITYDEVTPAQRKHGKVAELGAGYGMGWRNLKDYAKGMGIIMDDALAQHAVNSYRGQHNPVTRFWRRMDDAAKQAIKSPHIVLTVGRCAFRFNAS
jgi:DNA polymerase